VILAGRSQLLLAVIIGLALPRPSALAADVSAPVVQPVPPVFTASNRPRIGLVLGGGGAKGFAHIGVIEELERLQIPIDVIAGTSMGAVVGSIYAIGNDADEIKNIARSIDWNNVFTDSLQRRDLSFRRKREVRDIFLNARLGVENGKAVLPTGIFGGQKLFGTVQELLAPWRATEDFNNLPIPFRAIATNIRQRFLPACRYPRRFPRSSARACCSLMAAFPTICRSMWRAPWGWMLSLS
jgi:NTE family protein